MVLKTITHSTSVQIQPIVFGDAERQAIFSELFGEFVSQMLPENFPIIEQQLEKQPKLAAQFKTIIQQIFDLLNKHNNVDDFEEDVSAIVAQLNAVLGETEDDFYDNPEVVSARTELYSLKSGFDHGKEGQEMEIVVVDKEEWFSGGNSYSDQVKKLLTNRHKKFRTRMVPRFIAPAWAMKKVAAFKQLREIAAGISSQVVDSLPYFPTDDQQLKFLGMSANAVGGTTPVHAYGIVLNSHADVGATKSRKDKTPLPVPGQIPYAQRSAAGKVGIVISGNQGIGMLFEEDPLRPVVHYSRNEFDLRKAFKSHGVITLIGADVRARTTTLIGEGPMSDIPGSDCQITVCHQFFQLGVNLVDGDWTPTKKKQLISDVLEYFGSLYDINNGDRFLTKAVKKEDVLISQNPTTGEVTIKVNIQVKRAIKGVVICVNPTIPNRSHTS